MLTIEITEPSSLCYSASYHCLRSEWTS